MPLRIFEPRYRDMIKACIRDQSPFGVVKIAQGSEVWQGAQDPGPSILPVGVRVQVIDWYALDHNLLGIVIAGQQRFRVQDQRRDAQGLLQANIVPRDMPACTLDEPDRQLFRSIWGDIQRHPALQELGYPEDPGSDDALLGCLGQVLPIDENEKYRLLESFGSAEHAAFLRRWLAGQGVC